MFAAGTWVLDTNTHVYTHIHIIYQHQYVYVDKYSFSLGVERAADATLAVCCMGVFLYTNMFYM